MQILLGLLYDATTLHGLDSTSKTIKDLEAKLNSLREEPKHLLNHVRRQLASRLEVPSNTPFRQIGLFEHPNLIGIAKQRHQGYQQELLSITEKREALARTRMSVMEKRAPLKNRLDSITNEIAQKEALLAGNIKQLEALQNEVSSLQQNLSKHCDFGNVLLKECKYVIQRIELVQIDRIQHSLEYNKTKENITNSLLRLHNSLAELKNALIPLDDALTDIDSKSVGLDKKYAQTLSAVQLLSEAIESYAYYENLTSGKSQSTEMRLVRRELEAARRRYDQLKLQIEQQRQTVAERRTTISETMKAVAKSLPSFTWGVFNDQGKHFNHPFQMGPMHSTTYKVLEILAGDVACLLDSTQAQSFHPGFLLHDSPREAEMSEGILWALIKHVAQNGGDALQYIITTSTEPPESLRVYERQRLSADSTDGLLFRKHFGVEQAELL